MKKYIKSTLLMLCGLALFTACSDDNDSNPTFVAPTEFVLNAPSVQDQLVDLGESTTITLTCSQPNYGYPAATTYNVYVAASSDMSDAVLFEINSSTTTLELDASTIASTLTDIYVAQGKTEDDFPMTVPVYFQAEAVMTATTGTVLEASRIKSNIVSINQAVLPFSLPDVTAPEALYIVGNFNGWSWDSALSMVPVYGATNILWHMVYIDGSGIKFNTALSWDGNEVGYDGITINSASELGDEIIESDGNIASSNPGWYLMIVNCGVNGRTITYDVTFNKPEVYLIGVAIGEWTELVESAKFEVPTTADGDFVSPVLPALAGNDDDGCVRIYCKIPDYDWWKSEFIVGLDGDNITYRAGGDDQDRVGCAEGDRVYLNFSTDTGSIKQ